MDRDRDAIDECYFFQESDTALSLQWTGITRDHLERAGIKLNISDGQWKIVLAVASGTAAAGPGRWISYSRNNNHYVGRARYEGKGYACKKISATVEVLLSVGLIVEERAHPGNLGQQSHFTGTPLLFEIAQSCVLSKRMIEPIRLKNDQGHLVTYTDTAGTFAWRREMEQINEMLGSIGLASTTPGLDLSQPSLPLGRIVVHPGSILLYRVFSRGSWTLGGRLYGGFWQGLPRALRATLTINGDAVAEPDHAQFHPRLLYALHGLQPDGDAYTIPGFDRAEAKRGWQILINADGKRIAIAALKAEMVRAGLDVLACGQNPRTCCTGQSRASDLLKALEEKHAPIKDAFYSGIGLALQFIDSQLLVCVLLRGMKRGIAALPVHDSLIVAARHAGLAEEIMADELEKVLRKLRKEQRLPGSR